MLPVKIAFVDIETTGTSLTRDRIIEIAVIRTENNKIVQKFRTLINPESYLPPEITRLTGINAADLENAPTFREIKQDLLKILDGCVFAAHNVRFDYGFIKNQFRQEEITFSAKNLCTVKLSRKLFPRYKRHNLDSLISRHHLKCPQRHRAMDDTKAIFDFYCLVRKQFPAETVEKAVNHLLKNPSAPIKVPPKILDNLPECPGVYIFYGERGVPLYVGKSVCLRDRILSHFSGDHASSKEMKIAQQVESIETVTTCGELGALLLEAKTVKVLQPLYNRVLREARRLVVLRQNQTGDGYEAPVMEEVSSIDNLKAEEILGVYKSRKQAKNSLSEIAEKNNLCKKLLGLEKSAGSCFGYQLEKCRGACLKKEKPAAYNARFALAFAANKLHRWPFDSAILIEEHDRDSDKKEWHLVDQWCYLGTINNPDDGPDFVKGTGRFDLDTYKILYRFLSAKNRKIKIKKVDRKIFTQSLRNRSL